MRPGIRKLLVTGGAGFIGSAFVRLAVKRGYELAVVDKLTYAGDVHRLREVRGKFRFYKADISCTKKINAIFSKEAPDAVVHFAAESHVDRSIDSALPFMETNVKGTYVLLEAARFNKTAKFLHISTDEVYGEIEHGSFTEDSPLKPNSPYSATKASADLLISSYVRTYGFPATVVRPCNNYGPWQYPEKLIPLAISRLINGQKIPVYAQGLNVREWLYVDDCAEGLLKILEKVKPGAVYNLGSGQEKRNIDVVKALIKETGSPEDAFEFVRDRPGHDLRYSLDSSRLADEIGWRPKITFEMGIKATVRWFINNKKWLFAKLS